MIIEGLFRLIGALPDTDSTAEREEGRLQALRKADERQERKIKDAKKALKDSDPNQLTEREFMEKILSIEARRGNEST